MVWANISAGFDTKARGITGNDQYDCAWYVVKNGSTIYKGSLVVNEHSGAALTGYVVPADDVSASDVFLGVAAETVIGDGTLTIAVYRKGQHSFYKGTAAITDVNVAFYCDAATGPTTIDNSGNVIVGYGREADGTTRLWIDIEPAIVA